nr:surface-adhesin E family protein [uncultured Moraxella sp.]
MKKMLIFCLGVLFFNFSFADESWKFISSLEDNSSIYIHTPSIKRSGNFVNAWLKYDLRSSNLIQAKNFKEMVKLNEYDCLNKKMHTLSASITSVNGEKVLVDKPSDWVYLPPDSMNYIILSSLCSK